MFRRLLLQSQRVKGRSLRICYHSRPYLPMHDLPRRFINFFTKSAFTNSQQESLNLIMLGDPVLRKRSEIVSFDSGITTTLSWLSPLSRDMASLMHKQYGAGLAAPQIGRSLRMFLMDETDPDDTNAPVQLDPVVVINPKILKLEGGWEFDFEGCLSVPLLAALVPRATTAHVSYIDGSGTAVSRQLRGWAARIFQHEVDHLDGVMFLDRVVAPQHIVMESELMRVDSTVDVSSILSLPSTPFEKIVRQPQEKKAFSRKRV